MLPWGSQYRNIASREGHAWVLASLDRDPQVIAAAQAAECAVQRLGCTGLLSLLAYSDGSAIADGIEGSTAAVVKVGDEDVCAVVRRLVTSPLGYDDVTLRLDNLQVANNTFGDGEERFTHDWIRHNERDMAALAWELVAAREQAGLGSTVVLHQLGHPEKRKAAADYDEHERYNAKVDMLTQSITPNMPLYISFRRRGRRQTELWYEPM